jgi:hypothetical protein
MKKLLALYTFVGLSLATLLPAHAETTNSSLITLGSRAGFEIGGQVAGYYYQEHLRPNVFFMEQYGPQFGITAAATKTFNHGLFAKADARFAYGNNHYNGSGSKDGNDDFLGEARVLGGKDFLTGKFGVSAYTGLGYRNLFNDLRGTTSQNAIGYRRDSQYLYLPVGITPRFRVTDNSRISTNFEYDWLVQGWQTTYLSDTSASEHDVVNKQHSGYGLRGSVMYEVASWAIGPYFSYWNIDQSSVKFTNTSACRFGCVEPSNETFELGLQATYHF